MMRLLELLFGVAIEPSVPSKDDRPSRVETRDAPPAEPPVREVSGIYRIVDGGFDGHRDP